MKRILIFLLALILIMLSACSDSGKDNQQTPDNQKDKTTETMPSDNKREENSGVTEVADKYTEVILYEDDNCRIICWGPSTNTSAYKLCFKFENKTADKKLVFYADNLEIEGTNLRMVRSYKLGDGVNAWGAMFTDPGSGMVGEFSYNKYDVPEFDIPKYENIAFTVHVADQAAYPEELVNLPVKLHFGSN